jgi:hypothetical protein
MSDRRSWPIAGIGKEAYDALAKGLPASELWSLLLDVLERRATSRTPAQLLQQWERDGFVRPAYIDQRTLVELDALLLAAAAPFEALELSPLAPLGSCSVVGLASQNKIVSALRGTEVISDPTNVLALECARRLRQDPGLVVRLTTCHRCVRAQEVPKLPGFAQHFRIFVMVTAGRERQDHAFVVEALLEHVRTHLGALDLLERHGYDFPDRSVTILATAARAALGDRIAAALNGKGNGSGDGVRVVRAELQHPYYHGLRFMISARSTNGDHFPLIDGGAFDWLAQLTSNRRLVLVASGMGAQLAAYLYRRS